MPLDAPPEVSASPVLPATVSAAPIEENPVVVAVLRLLSTTDVETGKFAVANRAALKEFYADNGGQPVWTNKTGLSTRGTAVVAELRRAPEFGLDAIGIDLLEVGELASTDAQANAEMRVGLAVLTYARQARGSRVDPATISRMIEMRTVSFDTAAVLTAVTTSEDAALSLRSFNPQHPGFQQLVKALAAHRAQPDSPDAVQRILVNMERWRWMPEQLGALHVWNNVPEQMARVIKAGETVLTERIVVGKPGSPTPTFSAEMKYVIFHPSWGVPEGIKANELGPMLRRASASSTWLLEENRRASSALARHQLRVFRNGQEINPDSVDWTKANVREFQFTQPPSNKNVLGVVKFRFPNRFDVYMHDTSERHLFGHPQRAYSHGCMRVQNPLKLAAVVLGHDKGWPADKIAGLVARSGTTDVTLDKPVPVHVTYFTAAADEAGKLQLFGDIYGWDHRVASALTGKSVPLPAQAVAPQATRVPVPRRTASSPGGTSVGSAYNPFSGLSAN